MREDGAKISYGVVSQALRERSCFSTILVFMRMFNYIWEIIALTIIFTMHTLLTSHFLAYEENQYITEYTLDIPMLSIL